MGDKGHRGYPLLKGEDCAKTKDQSRSGKAVQKDWNRKDQSQAGFRAAYPDEEGGQQKESSQET